MNFLYYILSIMSMIARGFLISPRVRCVTTRCFASIGKHDVMNASETYPSFHVYAHGIDTRYPHEPVPPEYLEHTQQMIQKWEKLKILQSDAYSEITKERIARDVLYSEADPCLAMFLKEGGLYDGTGFNDDDFTKET